MSADCCNKCGGSGWYRIESGMKVCDCPAGQSRTKWLSMSDAERRSASISGRKKKPKGDAADERPAGLPFQDGG